MNNFTQTLDLEKGVVTTTINGHKFENKIEKVVMPIEKGAGKSKKLGDKVNLNINGDIIPCESHAMHYQMYGRTKRRKSKSLLFKSWHTVRATFLAWLSIPFFIIGGLFYWPSAFFLFIADSLKCNIPFNPLKSWKNINDCEIVTGKPS